jgi:tetratricopeptide repeat protein 25
MFAQAEALYSKGDFEVALLHYHRGHQSKPDVDDFRLGIQKAKEAINNAIGDPKELKIKAPKASAGAERTKASHYRSAYLTAENAKKLRDIKDRQEKQLLGELHEDKVYLKDFLEDEEVVNRANENIKSLVITTLHYLDSRIEFWRQQKPIYARKKLGIKTMSGIAGASGRQALELKQVNACFRNIQRGIQQSKIMPCRKWSSF